MANRENKVRFGISNLHYFKITSIDEDGKLVYADPVKFPGAVSLSTDAEGDNDNFYADNTVYYVLSNNSGYSGDLEVAKVIKQFRIDILGEHLDANGNLIEAQDAVTSEFGLSFDVESDTGTIPKKFFRCSASRPNFEATTIEDSKEVNTETLNLTVMPTEYGKFISQTATETTPDSVKKNWHKSMELPDITPKTPEFSPDDQAEVELGTTIVSLTNTSPNATYYYAFYNDGSGVTNFTEYTGPILLNSSLSTFVSNGTLKMQAYGQVTTSSGDTKQSSTRIVTYKVKA